MRSIRCCLVAVLLAGCGGSSDEPRPEDPVPAPAVSPEPSEARDEGSAQTAGEEPEQAPVELLGTRVARVENSDMLLARQYTEQFFAGELEPLHQKFSASMQSSFPLAQLVALRERVRDEYGVEAEVLGQHRDVKDVYRRVRRWSRFDKHEGKIEIEWILRDEDSIAGLYVGPARQSE